MPLIQSLPQGKLDIIGDVHGQFEALQNLLHYLDYTPEGRHPQGRKIVFVGDLIDRGPDSPAMLDWFRQAHQQGNAFCVLGNHELNILNHEAKDGTGWFFTHRQEKDSYNYAPWNLAGEEKKAGYLELLKSQPIVLQRPDLRIVHAAWLPESIAKIQEYNDGDLLQLYQEWDDEINCCVKHAPWFDDYLEEQRIYAHSIENPTHEVPQLHATAAHDVYRSSRHPIRALTCGIEHAAPQPFFASGRWRFSIRNPWWDNYHDNAHVIIGHYWRQWYDIPQPKHREGMFQVPPHHWHGARKNVFCIDFSAGARWRDRRKNIAPCDSAYRLAALRWPEKTLVFDNGDIVKTAV